MMRKWFLWGVMTLISGPMAYAQTIRVDVRQVYLPVRVFKNGQAIKGLTLRNFRIWEEVENSQGKIEEIEQELVESVPYQNPRLALATAIDASGSMDSKSTVTGESKMEEAKSACALLFLSIFRAGHDQGLISEFAFESWRTIDNISGHSVVVLNKLYVDQNWTGSLDEINHGIGKIEVASGSTPLRDAIFILANLFQRADPAALRVAVVLTDGEESQGNINEKTLSEVINELQRNQVLVFTVGLYQTAMGRDILREVAVATGGEAFFDPDPSKLSATFLKVGHMIRDVYFVSYIAKSEMAGPRKIRVEVGEWDEKGKWHKNKAQLFYRKGYTFQP